MMLGILGYSIWEQYTWSIVVYGLCHKMIMRHHRLYTPLLIWSFLVLHPNLLFESFCSVYNIWHVPPSDPQLLKPPSIDVMAVG